MIDQERAREQAIELMAQAPVMDDVFGWKRTTGPDWTKEDIARLLLDALREAHFKTPCERCDGSGRDPMDRQRDIADRGWRAPCPTCAGTGMVDTGTRLTTALGCNQTGWWAGWIDGRGVVTLDQGRSRDVPVFVEVPYTESEPTQ